LRTNWERRKKNKNKPTQASEGRKKTRISNPNQKKNNYNDKLVCHPNPPVTHETELKLIEKKAFFVCFFKLTLATKFCISISLKMPLYPSCGEFGM
jgi:hypothetical protein